MSVVNEENVIYPSSIDAISDLKMNVSYDDSRKSPVLIYGHGFGGNKDTVPQSIRDRWVAAGFFVIVYDMRGRGTSGGVKDYGAREVYDVYDAVEYVKANYPSYVDETNINFSGYSGGGGTAYSLATKFPDYFGVICSHFGMNDYGFTEDGWWNQTTEYQATLTELIGGDPSAVPDNYRARMALAALVNNKYSRIRVYHDTEDAAVPVVHAQNWAAKQILEGLSNSIIDITTPEDTNRWYHGDPIAGNQAETNIINEPIWMGEILAETYKNPVIDDTGTFFVSGFVRTKKFQIFLGDGMGDSAAVDYNIGQYGSSFSVSNNDTSNSVTIYLDEYLLNPNKNYRVLITNETDDIRVSDYIAKSDEDGKISVGFTIEGGKVYSVNITPTTSIFQSNHQPGGQMRTKTSNGIIEIGLTSVDSSKKYRVKIGNEIKALNI